jgi:hypothetical protein
MAEGRRAERETLIAKDDGAPGDTVYLSRSHTTGNRACYHDASCRYADPETDDETTRRAAQRRTCPPCKLCILDTADCDGPHEGAATGDRLADRIREQVREGSLDLEGGDA